MKEIKDLNKWNKIPFSESKRLNIVKMAILHKPVFRFNIVSPFLILNILQSWSSVLNGILRLSPITYTAINDLIPFSLFLSFLSYVLVTFYFNFVRRWDFHIFFCAHFHSWFCLDLQWNLSNCLHQPFCQMFPVSCGFDDTPPLAGAGERFLGRTQPLRPRAFTTVVLTLKEQLNWA